MIVLYYSISDMNVLAKNQYSRSDYEISDTYEAGIALFGYEVKSARKGQVSLRGSWAGFIKGELYLIGAHIAPYPPAGPLPDYDPQRTRKLLLKSSEIARLIGKVHNTGLTIVPLQLYSKGRFIKISLGLGRKKKKFEKRETLRQRSVDREIQKSVRMRG